MELLSINERTAINVADVRKFITWFDVENQPCAEIQYIGGRVSQVYLAEDARAIHWYVAHNAVPAYFISDKWMPLE